MKLKGKTVMLYLATTKGQEAWLEKDKMTMLRWMCGVAKKGKTRNGYYESAHKLPKRTREMTDYGMRT